MARIEIVEEGQGCGCEPVGDTWIFCCVEHEAIITNMMSKEL